MIKCIVPVCICWSTNKFKYSFNGWIWNVQSTESLSAEEVCNLWSQTQALLLILIQLRSVTSTIYHTAERMVPKCRKRINEFL